MSIYFHPHQAPFIGMAVSLSNYHCYLKFHYFHSQMGGHTGPPLRFLDVYYFFFGYFIVFIFVGADLGVCPYMTAQLIFPYYYE